MLSFAEVDRGWSNVNNKLTLARSWVELNAQVDGICAVKWEDEVARVEVVVSELLEVDSESEAGGENDSGGGVLLVSQRAQGFQNSNLSFVVYILPRGEQSVVPLKPGLGSFAAGVQVEPVVARSEPEPVGSKACDMHVVVKDGSGNRSQLDSGGAGACENFNEPRDLIRRERLFHLLGILWLLASQL